MIQRFTQWHVPIILFLFLAPLYLSAQVTKKTGLPRVPVEKMHHPEWINQDFEIEDRISEFRKTGTKYGEIHLKGTSIPLILPQTLKLDRPSPLPRGRFTGRLLKIDRLYQFMVATMELLPSEKVELNQKIAGLPADNAQKRLEYAAWADAVASRYKDNELRETAKRLRNDAFQILGSKEDPPGSRPGSSSLDAAKEAQKAGADPVIVQALAHQGFSLALKGINDQAGLEQISREVGELLPDSTRPQSGKLTPDQHQNYSANPTRYYLATDSATRKRLDRDLMARVLEKGFVVTVTNHPEEFDSLVAAAKKDFPERPELAETILNQGLIKLVDQSQKLGRDDMIRLVGKIRDQYGQGELARSLSRKWLDNRQATQLADGDAEGRYSIGQDYLGLLGDRRTSAALFRESLQIDPQMQKSADALLALGWKKDGIRWIDPEEQSDTETRMPVPTQPMKAGSRPDGIANPPLPNQLTIRPQTATESLLGMSQEEVRSTLGSPERKSRVASQGQIMEMWNYEIPTGIQVVKFFQKSSKASPTVVSVYLLPK